MQKARQFFISQGQKLGLAGGALLAYVNNAMAALPTEATAAFTQLSTDSTSMIALIWPILAAVTGAFALMKLFKRGANRAV